MTNSDDPARGDAAALPTGQNWWNTIRFRFGLLLALALLPWLLITGLEAGRAQNDSRASEALRQDILAANTVSEVGLILRAGALGLEAVQGQLDGRGCEAAGQALLERLVGFDALVVQDAGGAITCATPAGLDAVSLVDPSDYGSDGFRIERAKVSVAGEAAMRDVVLLQGRRAATDETYTLVLPTSLGLRDVLTKAIGDAAQVSLTLPGGKAVLGADADRELVLDLQAQIGADEVAYIDIPELGEHGRRIASIYLPDLDLYVTVGRDMRADLPLFRGNTAFLLPIIAWAVGFGVIWLGTQSMLIAPLKRVRSAARDYADGRLARRVKLSDTAAGEVRGLAQTFNRMAGELQDRDARIADNLDEKDALLREIHHRVKNNLQIIISLLNMQERKVEGEEAAGAISETRARINAIAAVHRGLYESDDLRSINVGPFMSRLLSSVGDSLNLDARDITLSHACEPCTLSADSAIPVALFIVEGVGNAVEHGLQGGGRVDVSITCPEGRGITVEVSDNGRGVPDTSAMSGIGTRLMQGFARQLSAELSYSDNAPGLRARLHVPQEAVAVTAKDDPASFVVSRRTADAAG